MQQLGVQGRVALSHSGTREISPCVANTARRADPVNVTERTNSLIERVDEKAGDSLFDYFRQSAATERYYRGAAGCGFHRHQRAGFIYAARYHQCTRLPEQGTFLLH